MPETIEYSAVMAIHTIWLLARAEGIAWDGCRSLIRTGVLQILDVPPTWRFVGYFCMGYPMHDDDVPELEREGWERRRKMDGLIHRR